MTPSDITLVKNSFRQVVPIADQAAALFYARLFELDPSLRPLFRGDMQEQGRKLMAMIATAVAALERLDTIVPAVRQLGARHAGYGVQEDHYATVGTALLWTLEKGLGSDFTPAVKSAWTTTYTLLANTMIDAARSAQPTAA
jgi:hemoglobin-like flavoprotein